MAATLHGSPLRTGDTDVCPDVRPENLVKLAAALRDLNARIRTEGVDGGLAFSCDAAFLSRVGLLNLETDAGDLDLSYTPAGTSGYDDLVNGAVRFDLDGVAAPVAALRDIIRSKAAANRPKDLASLPILEELARKLGGS
ncbi:MAG TPA: hypothetical protein VGP64_04540 [Polyangia bacterium]